MSNVSCQDKDLSYSEEGKGIWNSPLYGATQRALKHSAFYVSAVSRVSIRPWLDQGK